MIHYVKLLMAENKLFFFYNTKSYQKVPQNISTENSIFLSRLFWTLLTRTSTKNNKINVINPLEITWPTGLEKELFKELY